MQRYLSNRSLLREPSRGERNFLIVVAIIFAVIGPAAFFEPYDWLQQNASAALNSKPYDGDGVVVAIDKDTLDARSETGWRRSDLAAVLRQVQRGNPRRIVIASQYFSDEPSQGGDELSAALEAPPEKPVWQIQLASSDLADLSDDPLPPPGFVYARESDGVDAAAKGRVVPAVMEFKPSLLNAPLKAPYSAASGEGTFPSLANIMSDGRQPRKNVLYVDLSYDPKSIPIYGAAAVMRDDFETSAFADKQVVIAFSNDRVRDLIGTPLDQYASRAQATILAAQTLIDGPSMYIGWLPGLLLAMIAGAAWFYLQRPYGRYLAIAVLIVLVASPFLLERHLIYQEASNGIAFLLVIFLGKLWQKSGHAARTYRDAAETKSWFLAQASHDLRQPIHAIGLLADRLTHTDLSDDQKEIVSKISWSVDNTSRIFRALLDIAAIESGALRPDIRPVSINELLAEIDGQNSLAAEEAGVEIRLVPCDLVVETDRALIGTVLQNLVANAIKYSRGKRVIVGCRRRRGRLALYVVDSGQGIAEADLKLVKKEFFRASKTSLLRSDNKGLGLAIVNRLTKLLDLKFELRSTPGRGTIASVQGLKIIDASVAARRESTGAKLPLEGLKVVLADDDEETLLATGQLLAQWGCAVSESLDFPTHPVNADILLTDFDFGGGNTLANETDVLASYVQSGIKIIILSGHHPDQIRAALPNIACLILAKPLRAAELRSALMSLRLE